MPKTEFDHLLDTFEDDLRKALVDGVPPGCNMPSIGFTPDHTPGLWSYEVTGLDETISADMGGEGTRVTDRFKHLVFFPTWSMGEFAFYGVGPGQKVTIDATSDSGLVIKQGDQVLASVDQKIVVLYHNSLHLDAVQAYYAQPVPSPLEV